MFSPLKWVSCRLHIGFCIFRYSVNVCLLISMFRPFTFYVVIDMVVLKSAILLVVFCFLFVSYVLCLFFLPTFRLGIFL